MDAPPTPRPISSLNILCTLLTLSLSSATHPVGSSCGFPRQWKHAVRMNPFLALLDSLLLLREIALSPHTWRAATHHAVVQRLDDTARVVRAKALKVARADPRVRGVISALCVLQYAKTCGYHGAPVFFVLATVLFAAWSSMEVLFCIACIHGAQLQHRPLLSSAPCLTPMVRAARWSFAPLGIVLLALLPVRLGAIPALAARLVLGWHACVLWLPLWLVSWSPACFRAFPDAGDSVLKTLVVLYALMVAFLVVAVVYWVAAIVGMGLVLAPLYVAGVGVRRAVRWCGAAEHAPGGVGSAVAGVVVALGSVAVCVLFVAQGTSREAWTEWLL